MTLTALPSLVRTSPTFVTEVDDFFSVGLPRLVTEVNLLETDLSAKQVTASAAAATATAKEILTDADATATAADRVQTGLDRTAAAGSASAASTSASTASTGASTATTKASEANASAVAAAASAASIAAGPVASVNGMTGTVTGVATLTSVQTLTNKTLTSPVINAPTGIVKGDVGLGNVDNTSNATERAATATLTNKTLTSPVINTPTGIVKSDVGLGNVDNTSNATERAATATLTNKTLTSPVINTPTGIVKGDVGLGNVDNTSNATERAATVTLTNKTLALGSNTVSGTTAQFNTALTDGDFATLAGTETLTNKTLTTPVINAPTGIVKGDVGLGNVDNTSNATERAATATLTNKTLTSPVINTPTGIVKGDVGLGNVDNTSNATERSAAATLTNKTLALGSNTISGTLAQFNTALSDGDFATLAGTETLTNKTLTAPVLANPSYSGATANGGTVTTIDINGGTIDGTVIGGTTPAAGSFTTVSASGSITSGASGGSDGSVVLKRASDGLTVGTLSADSANSQLDVTTAYAAIQFNTYAGQKALIDDTGLAVTGTLTTSGTPTFDSNIGYIGKSGSGLGGNWHYKDDTGTSRWLAGLLGSAGATAFSIYDIVNAKYALQVEANPARVDITTTGLAVTGALSATGSATAVFGTSMSAGQTFGPAGTGGGVFINTSSLSAIYNSGLAIDGSYAGGAALSTINLKALGVCSGGGYASNLAFWTSNETTASEKMRLDASGNLGLGVTPSAFPATKTIELPNGVMFSSWQGYSTYGILQNNYHDGVSWKYKVTNFASRFCANDGNVGGFQWYTAPSGTAGNTITFTQAMTLDASGNLLVGVTADTNVPTTGVTLRNSSGTTGNIGIGHASGIADGNPYINFAYNAGGIGSITQSGTTAVMYNTTSDARLKENITDANDAASLIDALQVRQFDWKADGSHQRYGFVAQELYEVAPEAVCKPQDPDEMMAVDYSKLVPMLVKELQSLRARVAQLEGI